MRNLRLAVLVAVAGALLPGCGPPSDVTIFPPRVPQGGRAVAITVSQSDPKRLIVASESGGLFRTFDGGVSFQHLDGFPTLYAVDVVMASLDHNTVIATASDDFAKVSGGGIWRSTDGGVSWTRPNGWPPAACGDDDRKAASGISHMPLTRTFHVATDCGLAVSNDNGATFTTTPLDTANRKLFAVLVINRSTGVAADNKRVWFLNNGQWMPSLSGPDDGSSFTPHAFASPFWAAGNIIYHAGRDRRLWFSTTSGGAWRLMLTHCDTMPAGCGNREPFVRVGRGLDGDPTHFDVYHGDGFSIFRQAVTVANPGGNLADWRPASSMDHRDPADLAFTPGFEEPLMLATDGGVHLTPDKGKNWKLTGSNVGGFVALQIGEMTGRQVGGNSPHLDLYYATQDNDIKGSSDGGATWTGGSICCEGAFLQSDRSNPAMIDGPVTGRKCDGCGNFDTQPHLGVGVQGFFRNAPNGGSNPDAHAPFQLIGPNYLQPVSVPPDEQYWLTGNRGANWDSLFRLPGTHVGNVFFSGNLADPVTYIALVMGAGATLVRVSSLSGTATIRRADSTGIQRIGVLGTHQASYAVVAVDPKNPDHLLAHDVFTGTKASRDGGISWFALPGLDAAASDTGRLLPSINFAPSVSTIAWDPSNSCHILVGTMQNGVIRSADGGLTWAQVRGSKRATIVTSFFFPATGTIWMSTYGRGLWKVNVDRAPPTSGRCSFPGQPGDVNDPLPPVAIARGGGAPRPFTGLQDSIVCPACTVLLAYDGWITDIEGDAEIQFVSTWDGHVEQRDRSGREVPVTVANRVRLEESDRLRRMRGNSADERHVRGLVLNGRRLVALLMSRDQLPIASLRKPAIFTRTLPGDSVQILGFQFLPGKVGVTLLVEQDTVATGITVGADGRFDTRVHVPRRAPGIVFVKAFQVDGLRTTVATTRLQVVARESR